MISVGIDIGSFSVKIAEVESAARGFTLTRYKEFPLSQDPTKDQSIEVLDSLRTLFAQVDPAQIRVVFGEKQGHVSSRFLEFPFRERHKILKSLPFELEEDIPFFLENAVFDAKILKYQRNLTKILAIAAPLGHVERWYQLATDSGIHGDILSVDGIAYCNLLENWESPPPESNQDQPELPEAEPAELHLILGHKSTLLIVRSNGILRAIRSIDWGGKNIADTIGRKYSVGNVEALKELRAKGFVLLNEEGATRDQIQLSNTIKQAIDQLAHDLKLTFFEIESELNVQIRSGFMLGGLSQLKGLGAYLTQKLEIPFNRFQYFNQISHFGLETSPEMESRAAISIGLAVEGLKKPRNPAINLFKGDFEKKSQDLQKLWNKWKHAAQVAAAIFVLLIFWGVARESISRDLSDSSYAVLRTQAQNVAGLRGASANLRSINQFLRRQESIEKNRDLAEKAKDINSAIELLNEVSQRIPPSREIKLDVKRFLVENNTLELEGEIQGTQGLKELRQALVSLAADGNVETLTPARPPAPGRQLFSFRIKVNRVSGS